MDKIKVCKELAEDLDFVKKNYSFEIIIDLHINKNWKSGYTKQLKELELEKLCELLINGYEIEETPEEKILKIYKDCKENYPGEINFRNGIELALNVLNIKIKGIND